MDTSNTELIKLEHGSGGWLSKQLIDEIIFPAFRGNSYQALQDSSPFSLKGEGLLTTDTYVVDPPFFPGSDIGKLAVNGTCNDISVAGGIPLVLSLGFIVEEGFPIVQVKRVLESIRAAADEAEVRVITGDTKVVPAGKGGGIYINSSGVGRKMFSSTLTPKNVREGDVIIVSGPVGEHGIAVLAEREKLPVAAHLRSDCANLYPICKDLFSLEQDLRFLRDVTRGGLSAILNEIVQDTDFGFIIEEESIPVKDRVASVSEILGLNPLEVANEGVVVGIVAQNVAQEALRILHNNTLGQEAAIIGSVTASTPKKVILRTRIGGRRVLDFPRGLLLPRIC